MADYVLTDGKGTKVRMVDSLLHGYVDIDMEEGLSSYAVLEDADTLVVQRGAADPRTATKAVLLAGLQSSLTETDWLNKAYIY